MLRYYIFCIKWLWKNRTWADGKHKFRAMEKEWNKYSREKKLKRYKHN